MRAASCQASCAPGAFCEFVTAHGFWLGWLPCLTTLVLVVFFTAAAGVARQAGRRFTPDSPEARDAERTTLMWLRYAKLAAAALLTIACIIAAGGFGCRCLALDWPLALVPSLIVVLYLFQQLMQRSRRIQSVNLDPPYPDWYTPSSGEAAWFKDLRRSFQEVANQLRYAIGEHYSNPGLLLVRLGAPAGLLFLVSSALLVIVAREDVSWLNPALREFADPKHQHPVLLTTLVLRGLRYGAAGAYVWVLLELTERCFRRDMTPGSILWSAATLVLGPLLGAFLALVLKLEVPKDGSIWQSGVVLFFAGFAPRRIVEIASAAAQQMLRSGPAPTPNPNLIPLGTLRGMTPSIVERLGQEGIQDGFMLAFADPVRLLRNTAYDLRQIVAWMDQALLLVFCPKLVHGLAEAGLTGATDLAFYEIVRRCHDEAKRARASQSGMLGDAAPPPPASEQAPQNQGAAAAEDPFGGLAKASQLDPDVLRDAAARLYFDEQVRLIWVLYNTFSTQPGDSMSAGESLRSGDGQRSP
jgi:hypothetical protein